MQLLTRLKILLRYNLLIIFLLLLAIFNIFKIEYLQSKYNTEKQINGTISSIKRDGDTLKIILYGKEKLIVFYKYKSLSELNDCKLKIGDVISLEGEFSEPSNSTNFYNFDYKNYLYSINIKKIFKSNKISVIGYNMLFFSKTSIHKFIDSKEKNEYLKLIILGDYDLVDDNFIASTITTNVIHLFSISSLHITLIGNTLLKLFKFKLKDKPAKIITFLLLFNFIFITGFSISSLRSLIIYIITNLKKVNNKKVTTIFFLILIIYNPFIRYNIGFLYSFIISYFLMILPKIKNKYNFIYIPIYIFILIIPINLITTYTINPISIVANIILVPFYSYIVFPLSIIELCISTPIFQIVINFLIVIITFFNDISINIVIGRMYIYLFILYYVIIAIIINNKKYSNLIYLLIIIIFTKFNYKLNNSYILTALDVGQGDSFIIEFPYQSKVIMIDTGGINLYKKEWQKKKRVSSITDDIIMPYLHAKGITKIDYMIISHGDQDHIGEAFNIINKMNVNKVILNCGNNSSLELDLINKIDKMNIQIETCINELLIDNIKLSFLDNKDYGNENESSNVIYTEMNGFKLMFMGDAGIKKEKDLIEKYNIKDIDILKVGHHGSKTSSSIEFIEKINPKISVISVGKSNRYGHPNNEVLQILSKSKIYRTDIQGSIIFNITKNKIETSPKRY